MSTTDVQNIDLDSVDLADPAVWDDGVPYDLFARMQREAPGHLSPQRNMPEEGGFGSIPPFDGVCAGTGDTSARAFAARPPPPPRGSARCWARHPRTTPSWCTGPTCSPHSKTRRSGS